MWVTPVDGTQQAANVESVDAQIIKDASSFKMDLVAGLKRTLQGQVKPLITQCSMRELYETKDQPLIAQAKEYERRRCNHRPDEQRREFAQCLKEVLDPKGSHTNKHRYIVATQDADVRAEMRRIPGVPLIYISRSVMILEPMASATEKVRSREEKGKFRAGIKGARGSQVLGKRTRDSEESGDENGELSTAAQGRETTEQKTKKKRGPKGPNPLSVKKPKKKPLENSASRQDKSVANRSIDEGEQAKRKRKRRRKSKMDEENVEPA